MAVRRGVRGLGDFRVEERWALMAADCKATGLWRRYGVSGLSQSFQKAQRRNSFLRYRPPVVALGMILRVSHLSKNILTPSPRFSNSLRAQACNDGFSKN